MSRIATLTAVLTMLVAPAAFAGQDLRSPDVRDIAGPVKVDLRSPDAASPMANVATPVARALRSPHGRDRFSPSARAVVAAQPTDNPSAIGLWGVLGIIAAALAASAVLVAMLRRHRQVGGPVGV